MPPADSGATTLAYEIHGDGPPVVLVHGFASSFRRNWSDPGWVVHLRRHGFQVIGPDMRGHGRSPRFHDPAAYATPLLAADILAMLDHLGLPRVDLIGFSMGGGVALHLGMFHPERFRRIVAGGIGDSLLPGGHDPQQLAAIAAALRTPHPETLTEPLPRLFRDFAERGGNDLAALTAAMSGNGWPGHLVAEGPIALPVLLVHASQEQIIAGTQRLHRMLPQADVVVIPDRHHNSMVGDRRFKEAVTAFLARD
jgi:pimeloyl-ACP methyl ester carboxylesterase